MPLSILYHRPLRIHHSIRHLSTALAHAHTEAPYLTPTPPPLSEPQEKLVQILSSAPTPPLSDSQEKLVQILSSGSNVFFTGKAGTGKTAVLNEFVGRVRKSGKRVAVTSPTGIAAANLNGQTLHSFMSHVGSSTSSITSLTHHVQRSTIRRKPYEETDILVIDEASMVDPILFNTLDHVSRVIRKVYDRPFGGMQVVLCGDFWQLPPVCVGREAGYVFESRAWKALVNRGMRMVELSQIFRQTDKVFVEVLSRVRRGVYDEFVQKALQGCVGRTWEDEDVLEPTLITGYNRVAQQYNHLALHRLPEAVTTFTANDSFEAGRDTMRLVPEFQEVIDGHFNSFAAPRTLHLKPGAQVVLLRNMAVNQGLVNGARGHVVGYKTALDPVLDTHVSLPIVQFADRKIFCVGYHRFEMSLGPGRGVLVRKQIPLKLAWALTVHKSQGMTLDRVEVDLEAAFASGQAYTALSRVKGLEGLRVKAFGGKSVFVSDKVVEFGKRYQMMTL
ncbi:hypothetical protein SpCBS45565_g06396 [Spizellomyces sp. 'palustris']|nr:hypothetical protein SpCBS45565_g06396 [Spizellomyces sp. 'palustris']